MIYKTVKLGPFTFGKQRIISRVAFWSIRKCFGKMLPYKYCITLGKLYGKTRRENIVV